MSPSAVSKTQWRRGPPCPLAGSRGLSSSGLSPHGCRLPPPGPGAGAFLLDPGSLSAQLSGFCQTGQDPRTVTLCPRGSSVSLRGGQTGGIDTHPADERARGAGPRDRAGLVFAPCPPSLCLPSPQLLRVTFQHRPHVSPRSPHRRPPPASPPASTNVPLSLRRPRHGHERPPCDVRRSRCLSVSGECVAHPEPTQRHASNRPPGNGGAAEKASFPNRQGPNVHSRDLRFPRKGNT